MHVDNVVCVIQYKQWHQYKNLRDTEWYRINIHVQKQNKINFNKRLYQFNSGVLLRSTKYYLHNPQTLHFKYRIIAKHFET